MFDDGESPMLRFGVHGADPITVRSLSCFENGERGNQNGFTTNGDKYHLFYRLWLWVLHQETVNFEYVKTSWFKTDLPA